MGLCKLDFLWINMPENEKYPITFDGSFPYRIPIKYVEQFIGYKVKTIYGLTKTRFYCGLINLKIRISQQLSVKVSHIKF
jgi:hypothetical protein